MIPPILSQTWKTVSLPAPAAAFAAGWQALNPQLEHRVYDDHAARDVFAEAFPDFLGDFDELPLPILRADLFRYAVLWRDGGIYADIDMECLRPIAPLLKRHSSLFSIEAHLTRRRQIELGYPEPVQIANCIMAAPPRQPVFRSLVEHAIKLIRGSNEVDAGQVEDLTGPRMLTRFLLTRPWPDIHVLPQIVLMAPLHYPFVFPLNRNMHARHHTFGSWKRNSGTLSLRRRLIERNKWPQPFPPGYHAGPASS